MKNSNSNVLLIPHSWIYGYCVLVTFRMTHKWPRKLIYRNASRKRTLLREKKVQAKISTFLKFKQERENNEDVI